MLLHVSCELLLSLSCLWAAARSLGQGRVWAMGGFLLMGTAALLGAVQYAGVAAAAPWHQAVTQLSGRLGLLLIAVGGLQQHGQRLLLLVAAVVLWFVPENLALAGNLLALLAIAWRGRSQRWPLAVAGSLLFPVAALLVGTHGEWFGVARLDLFHLLLAVAVLCWSQAGLRAFTRISATSSLQSV